MKSKPTAILLLSILPLFLFSAGLSFGAQSNPGECWADPYPSDAPNYRVDCADPACDVGPCTNSSPECWYDPTQNYPDASREQSQRVSCADPRCNLGPCTGSGTAVSGSAGTGVTNVAEPAPVPAQTSGGSSAGAPGSTGSVNAPPAEPSEVPAHTPEWTNLNDSDPGVASDVQETDTEKVTQRNESDMEFLRGRAAEREKEPTIFVRILNFLTNWFW